MRLFQNSGLYPTYRRQFDRLHGTGQDFAQRRDLYIKDRYNALHYLLPILNGEPSGFVTNADDEILQRAWAAEKGLPRKSSPSDILLAQIEEHRTEVFYNLDPMRFGSDFIRRLPGTVRHSLAWRAAPSPGADFSAYSRVLNNFPSILDAYRKAGWAVEYFAPGHDPVMDHYAANEDRPIDILFVGGYTRHHRNRARILEGVAELAGQFNICYHLEQSRMTRLAESPLGILPSLAKHRRPDVIRHISAGPIFGLDLYAAIAKAKIVLNGAIDMAGEDRGNMRCFEAMGAGALLVSDTGRYPEGMDAETMVTYQSLDDLLPKLKKLIHNTQTSRDLASRGFQMMSRTYSKQRQWLGFQNIVGAI